jgi:hypothetical protein
MLIGASARAESADNESIAAAARHERLRSIAFVVMEALH